MMHKTTKKQKHGLVNVFGLLAIVLFLFSCVNGSLLYAAAKKDTDAPTYKFVKILKGCTKTRPRAGLNAEADLRGGQMKVKMQYKKDCSEKYLFTWKFDRDISTLKPGDTFNVTLGVKTVSPQCVNNSPFITASGNYGNVSYIVREIKDQLEGIGRASTRGYSRRVHAKPLGKSKRTVGSKTVELRLWEKSKSGGTTWFEISIHTASPIKGQGFTYEIIYMYKAV
jgi:hypothetical protein